MKRSVLIPAAILLFSPTVSRAEGTTSLFPPTVENMAPSPGPSPEGMVWIPGGEFSMGSFECVTSHCSPVTAADATPVVRVFADGFWADRTEVTNAHFAKWAGKRLSAHSNKKRNIHRGGLFLCADQYFKRYTVGTRGKGKMSTAGNHVGFCCKKFPL